MSLSHLEMALDIIDGNVTCEDLYDLDEEYQNELREKLLEAAEKLNQLAEDLRI